MASSMHSVHWYVVKTTREHGDFQAKSAMLEFVGSQSFRSSTIVHSCWSPHLSEESVVLLENGQIYLFDLSSCFKEPLSSNNRVRKKKLQVLWDASDLHDNHPGGCWLSCEFSWHPRILVVAHTSAVFLVDARTEGCNISCLLKIQMLSTIQNDGFIALSRAGSNGFNFCVASKKLLFLCDVRQPWRPLLQWMHHLDNPHYLTVFGLSDLRPSNDEKYKWASESGSCILLGSFWNCEFSLFIYGPNNSRRSISSEISKFCKSFYAWGLPSGLSLSGRDCCCGSCLLRDEFLEDSLPKWIDWRQKKDVVLGFAILPLENFPQFPKRDNSGGFFLIRLMSSGKLEAQIYCATSEFHKISSEAHVKPLSDSGDNLFYDTHRFDYNLKKKFQLLKLDYFKAYLKGNLAESLVEKLKYFRETVPENDAENESSQKLETDGSNGSVMFRSFEAFEDINFPISINEIALRVIWSQLQLAFSSQSKFPRVADFLSISHHIGQFPFQTPSFHHNKLLHCIQPSDDLLGSFLPPQFLFTLHKLSNLKLSTNLDVLSADNGIKLQCDRILEVADKLHDGHGISLSDDADKLSEGDENVENFCLHELGALSEISVEETAPIKSGMENKRFTKFIFRKQQDHVCDVDEEMAGLELLDKGCPLELKFKNNSVSFGKEELKQFKLLKKQDVNFQKGFILYQEFITKTNLVNKGI